MKANQKAILLFLMAVAHSALADEKMQVRPPPRNAPEACVCTLSQTEQLLMANCSCGSKQCVVSLTSYTTTQPTMQCFEAVNPASPAVDNSEAPK
jgi:hypothetical protein